MKVAVVRIGNSQGVRIPKPVIEQCGFGSEVELEVRGNTLVIAPVRTLREGWDESFRAMAEAGDDQSLWPEDVVNRFDDEEWEW
ncbi:MAG: AbrB/MazE/SpoVT family DNA-binding domain-containing protein [Alphaproteobacteria bacterium]